MPKPRYEAEKNVSRHAAADADCCEEMADRNGWKLVDVEETGNADLPVDCVFELLQQQPRALAKPSVGKSASESRSGV